MSQTMELVVFQLKTGVSHAAFLHANAQVNDWVKTRPGFVSRTLTHKEALWHDVVFWQDANSAQSASKQFMLDLITSDFMAMIEPTSVQMSHHTVQATSTATIFNGCEFSVFNAKEGVSDEQLIAASLKMEQAFLHKEPGFIHHALLKGDHGAWADTVFTHSKSAAEQICQNFMSHPACLEYLQLIEDGSASLTFWNRAH